ncbi:MAG: DUF5615 family PIN-like protein [Planctomycetes bacterium]|nr:DUF5615 family PIN-like protein [Planctomycetota bacterium]
MAERIRYYTDEHVAKAVSRGLRQRGVDVLTVPEANMLGAADKEHLRMAAEQGRVIFTQDDDYLRLHAQGVRHCGIVYAPQHTPIGTIVSGLMLLSQVATPEEMHDRIEFL